MCQVLQSPAKKNNKKLLLTRNRAGLTLDALNKYFKKKGQSCKPDDTGFFFSVQARGLFLSFFPFLFLKYLSDRFRQRSPVCVRTGRRTTAHKTAFHFCTANHSVVTRACPRGLKRCYANSK